VRLLRSSAADDDGAQRQEDVRDSGTDLTSRPRVHSAPRSCAFLANLEISGTRWLCSLRLT
jgi:hypothetical protein